MAKLQLVVDEHKGSWDTFKKHLNGSTKRVIELYNIMKKQTILMCIAIVPTSIYIPFGVRSHLEYRADYVEMSEQLFDRKSADTPSPSLHDINDDATMKCCKNVCLWWNRL